MPQPRKIGRGHTSPVQIDPFAVDLENAGAGLQPQFLLLARLEFPLQLRPVIFQIHMHGVAAGQPKCRRKRLVRQREIVVLPVGGKREILQHGRDPRRKCRARDLAQSEPRQGRHHVLLNHPVFFFVVRELRFLRRRAQPPLRNIAPLS